MCLLLVFTVTPFKIDQNKNRNGSIDKVQNLENERRDIYKDPRQKKVIECRKKGNLVQKRGNKRGILIG